MNVLCSRLIQTLEYAVQVRRASMRRNLTEPLAQIFGAFRTGEKAIQQGTQVESSASDNDWQMPTSADLSQYRARLTCIFACRDRLCGINKIQKVMRRLSPFTWGRFGGPDIELAVHRHRVTVDDLSVESLSDRQG